MAQLRAHLRRAPIVEAVVDFRVQRQEQIDPGSFAGIGHLVGERYSERTVIQSLEIRFGLPPLKLPVRGPEAIGYRYRDSSEIAQFRGDGFTFSKIEPYTTWDAVFGEAFRLWQIYLQVAPPKQISRIAVRYINRMKMEAGIDLQRVLEAPPSVPAPIPQTIRDFLTRIHIDDESRLASAVIVQALERRVDMPITTSVLLDIDAFRDINTVPTDPELPEIFQRLRELKNEVFFGSITEERAEMYE
jgi:uncharacterized protein (TIGR04255 family)